ncbi:hypothetical protein L1871_23485 (plasmid) [Aeromonas caviae]|uniref:hypothetical protein n=1 Tax=Aeromonas caviae TaxID=648 RepID=UPI001F42D175|nr:hypothetical protein [Aeromonas caviae]UJQ39403.1 hypothetical protein L1871_23485 [Aeromonas caviae]
MRYLPVLLLSPSLAFAACAPGVNYGSLGISSPSPTCIAYSGSSLGGCSAYCGGGAGSTVCVELPLDTPPSKGPYFSDGNECEIGGGGDDGGGDNGGGDNGGGNNGGGGGDVGPNASMYHAPSTWVGNLQSANLAPAFDSVSLNIERLKNLVGQESRAARYEMSFMVKDLARIAQNTSGMNGGAGTYGPLLYEMNAHLKSLSEKSVFEPNFWNDKDIARTNQLSDMRQDISYLGWELKNISDILSSGGGSSGGGSSGGGSSGDLSAIQGDVASLKAMQQSLMSTIGSISGNTSSISSNMGSLLGSIGSLQGSVNSVNSNISSQSGYLSQMNDNLYGIKYMLQDGLKNGWGNSGGGQGDDGGGDKPCTGPLCSFTKPSSSSGSALSKVFSNESIEDVKVQIENKDNEISAAMNDIKSVFAPEELTITGTYNNDYHDINGVRVDLSGKSNLELFFNSGPKMAIWFLAVLLAFSILMGGRKNA